MLKRNQIFRNGFRYLLISLLSLSYQLTQANEASISPDPLVAIQAPATNDIELNQPAISIIIDDMGYRLKSGNRAVNLSGNLTYSFLPHSPHALELSQRAHSKSKEIMLHLPMEAMSGNKLGPGGLTESMTEQKFVEVLESNIASIPHISGFNNHMGSLLTKSKFWMKRLMREIAPEKKLFFVDSRTTRDSVALNVARAEGVNSITRDIFIDHELTDKFINMQLKKLIKKAQRKGTALAIAHPQKITLSILEKWLPTLEAQGIQLVSVSKLIALQKQRTIALWKPQHLMNHN